MMATGFPLQRSCGCLYMVIYIHEVRVKYLITALWNKVIIKVYRIKKLYDLIRTCISCVFQIFLSTDWSHDEQSVFYKIFVFNKTQAIIWRVDGGDFYGWWSSWHARWLVCWDETKLFHTNLRFSGSQAFTVFVLCCRIAPPQKLWQNWVQKVPNHYICIQYLGADDTHSPCDSVPRHVWRNW